MFFYYIQYDWITAKQWERSESESNISQNLAPNSWNKKVFHFAISNTGKK